MRPRGGRQLDILLERNSTIDNVSKTESFAICDFWIGESLALAKVLGSADEIAAIEKAFFKELTNRYPKLLVLIAYGHSSELSTSNLSEFQNHLIDVSNIPNPTPMLKLDTTDPQEIAEEVVATVRTMGRH